MTDTNTQPDYHGHRQRLRQRFMSSLGKDMADYELLELVLTTVIPRRDVKPIAKALIKKFGSFAHVINAPTEALLLVEGIKESSAVALKVIQAAMERAAWQNLEDSEKPVILTQDALIDYCRIAISFSDVEELHVIYLSNSGHVIKKELMQKGTVNMVYTHPREVVRHALGYGASGIILVHNHPSGNVTPSPADLNITMQIMQACKTVGIKLADHVIISQSDYYSFDAHKLLD